MGTRTRMCIEVPSWSRGGGGGGGGAAPPPPAGRPQAEGGDTPHGAPRPCAGGGGGGGGGRRPRPPPRRRAASCHDEQAHDTRVAARLAVGGAVEERVGADVIDVWCICEGAVGVQRQLAVTRPADEDRRQRVVIDVVVVAQDARAEYAQRFVLVNRVAVIDRYRGVVDRVDVNRHAH